MIECDAAAYLRRFPPDSIDAVITDPPWIGHAIDYGNGIDVDQALFDFEMFCREIPRVTQRLIVVLGCNTDPRPLRMIPPALPFVRVIRLEHIPPRHRGPILVDADYAYAFGHNRLNPPHRLLPGLSKARAQQYREADWLQHPTPRALPHMKFLVYYYSREGHLIVDPFAGSGTTLVAAKMLNRRFAGCDLNSEYVTQANRRLADINDLFVNENRDADTHRGQVSVFSSDSGES